MKREYWTVNINSKIPVYRDYDEYPSNLFVGVNYPPEKDLNSVKIEGNIPSVKMQVRQYYDADLIKLYLGEEEYFQFRNFAKSENSRQQVEENAKKVWRQF